MTQTIPPLYLPVGTVFDTIDPTYGPGWRTPDPDGPRFTAGHVDAGTFESRIKPFPGVGPLHIDPETLRHDWLRFSYHDEECLTFISEHRQACPAVNSGGICDETGTTVCDVTGDDTTTCGGACCHFTGVEDGDGNGVHLIYGATADTPDAFAVTWGCASYAEVLTFNDELVEVAG